MKDSKPSYESSKLLARYPSGSTLCQLEGKFYIMGDDAADVLVLDGKWNELHRIAIFPKGDQLRLPKASKADVESSVVFDNNGKPAILFLGSGSHSPHRDSMFVLDPELKHVKRVDASSFYDELRGEVKELNIEAAAMLDNQLLLGLRGNNTFPDNYMALADHSGATFKFHRKILIQAPVPHAGISGMDYDARQDILFITFSSEDTANAYDDGQIGESYLSIVNNAKQLLKKDKLVLTEFLKLSDLHPEFIEQKIESVSLSNEPGRLMLIADDDKGNTKIFSLRY
ncbi:DUF6929 family protein [Daejeonella lutea]|uniref:DUF3616 domain-containing protein n=1 Tax=Daejeonella lutea TaxID=572036 RepID=A0A1T5ECE2_9SPHI|nr:hypothetical protein [Daejeonella lutea]SKB81578.1 hypothetical protein SAMN05661099_2883 [Daejeonella lutea]